MNIGICAKHNPGGNYRCQKMLHYLCMYRYIYVHTLFVHIILYIHVHM